MRIVKRLLREGKSKDSIFEKASEEGLNLKKVSKYLAMYPDLEESESYSSANNTLIGIYLVWILLGLLSIAPILPEFPVATVIGFIAFEVLIPVLVLYCIYRKISIGYLILLFFLFINILRLFGAGVIDVLSEVCINAFFIAYVVILKNKLFPYQNFFNTKKNAKGLSIFKKDSTSICDSTVAKN